VTADGGGRVLARTKSVYDGAGRLTTVTALNADDRVVSETLYSYDERGSITQIVQNHPAARLRTRTDFRYDADGKLVEQVRCNRLDRPVEIIRYTYEHYRDR
jgi:YD repeat-containing protein